MTKANGTDAKDIGLYFLKATGVERATPAIIGKTIAQVKHILEAGYTKEEIIITIDHILAKGIKMYSIGYVSHAINDALREIEQEELKRKAKEITKQLEQSHAEKRSEVKHDDESTERNREKARRLQSSVQSRKREKFNFDMFEGQ